MCKIKLTYLLNEEMFAYILDTKKNINIDIESPSLCEYDTGYTIDNT